MKIINEKGKLFGLINIIDLAVVLALVLLVVGGAKRFKNKPIIKDESTEAIITYEVAEIRQATVDNLVVGDKLQHYDRGGIVGEIVEVNIEPHKEELEYNGEWVNAEVPGKFDAYIKVKANVSDSPDVIVVGGEQTRVGTQYRMKSKRAAFFGTAMEIELLD